MPHVSRAEASQEQALQSDAQVCVQVRPLLVSTFAISFILLFCLFNLDVKVFVSLERSWFVMLSLLLVFPPIFIFGLAQCEEIFLPIDIDSLSFASFILLQSVYLQHRGP